MYKQFYRDMDFTHLPLFALVLFVGFFLAVVAWAFVLRRAPDFDAAALMPLAEGGEGSQQRVQAPKGLEEGRV